MLGQIRTARGIETIPLTSMHLEKRNIFLNGEINAEVANQFCEQFMYLLQKDSTEPIQVWINSPGGSVPDGLHIYDMITGAKDVPVSTVAYGYACSMAGILFAAGTKGHRLMLPHSKVMLHPASYCGNVGGNVKEMKVKSDMLQEYERITQELLAKHTGQTMEVIEKETSYEHFFSAEESVTFGLADKIVAFNALI